MNTKDNKISFENREQLKSYQLERVNRLLSVVLPKNRFYQDKLTTDRLAIDSWDQWQSIPYTTKEELSRSASQTGLAPNHTYPPADYVRFHRTSGSMGRPLIVMDRPEDWRWWLDCWDYVLNGAGIGREDVVFMAFSFGPFIGFWTAHDACLKRGCRVVPGGGLSSAARLELIAASQANVLFCTPTYALHLANEAKQRGVDTTQLGIRKIVVAGEAGGSDPVLQKRIESAYDAVVYDHSGATEVGAWGFATSDRTGLHVIETEFIAEFLPAGTHHDRDLFELVLTSLGRCGAPLIRYRTGDLVDPELRDSVPLEFVRLNQGVLARADQMMTIRGVNVFPSSIEAILREFPSVEEFRLTASKQSEMDQLEIEVEDHNHGPESIADLIDLRLGLRVKVVEVPPGTIARSQDKSKRFIDNRR